MDSPEELVRLLRVAENELRTQAFVTDADRNLSEVCFRAADTIEDLTAENKELRRQFTMYRGTASEVVKQLDKTKNLLSLANSRVAGFLREVSCTDCNPGDK